MDAYLFIDGASRGNPGPASCSFILANDAGDRLAFGGWYLGETTTNIASYMGLIWGMRNAEALKVGNLTVFADSQTLVAQMNGEEEATDVLANLLERSRALSRSFGEFAIEHIRRTDNKQAARYMTEAIVERTQKGSFQVGLEDAEGLLAPRREPRLAVVPPPIYLEDDDEPEDAPSAFLDEVLNSDDYLLKAGEYELTVKGRFTVTLARYAEPAAWSVQARVASSRLDAEGRMYAIDDLKAALAHTVAPFDGRVIGGVEPFDHLPPTMEHLVRVIFWQLAEQLPDHVELREVAIWSNASGAKMAYRRGMR